LKPNDVILDVAGGKGDLSWLLQNVDGLQSIVVDPRKLASKSHLLRSVQWLQLHPHESQQRALPHLPTHQPLAALMPQIMKLAERRRQRKRTELQSSINNDPSQRRSHENQENECEHLEPPQFQMKLEQSLVDAVKESLQQQQQQQEQHVNDRCPPSWRQFWETAVLNQYATFEEKRYREDFFLPTSERRVNDPQPTTIIQDANLAWQILQSVKLIVGFHPDQATDACVDLARVLGVPVCIVPCCVFPSEFQNRQLFVRNSSTAAHPPPKSPSPVHNKIDTTTKAVRVREYHQLLLYLQQRHPCLHKDTLAFHETATSRNAVLFTLPQDIKNDLYQTVERS